MLEYDYWLIQNLVVHRLCQYKKPTMKVTSKTMNK